VERTDAPFFGLERTLPLKIENARKVIPFEAQNGFDILVKASSAPTVSLTSWEEPFPSRKWVFPQRSSADVGPSVNKSSSTKNVSQKSLPLVLKAYPLGSLSFLILFRPQNLNTQSPLNPRNLNSLSYSVNLIWSSRNTLRKVNLTIVWSVEPKLEVQKYNVINLNLSCILPTPIEPKLELPKLNNSDFADWWSEPMLGPTRSPNHPYPELHYRSTKSNSPKVSRWTVPIHVCQLKIIAFNQMNNFRINSDHMNNSFSKRTIWSENFRNDASDPEADSRSCRGRLRRSGDVELNPGPAPSIKVISNNVRGLNNEAKLRHLVNACNNGNLGKNCDMIYCFQETFIETELKLPYLWRGNYHVTPGTGNSCGCVTLLSSHINIIEARNLGSRGHVLACQRSGNLGVNYIIANIYAPCANTREKLEFFEKLFEETEELSEKYGCSNVIVLGDFNLVFKSREAKNRNFTAQEKRIAEIVKNRMDGLNLTDMWEEDFSFTWRRPNSDIMSCIDRFFYNKGLITVESRTVNWSVTYSDHAALEITITNNIHPSLPRSKIVRLDPALLREPNVKDSIRQELDSLITEMPIEWNPHTKLEYAKMCLRTVTEKVQAEVRKKEKSEEDYVNEELNLAINSLARRDRQDPDIEEIVEYIEDLRNEKARLIETKGERLASRLKTKWYNEGEKSNRYFLNLLKRPQPDDFKKIEVDGGGVLCSELEIQEEIVRFYKNLYENYDRSNLNTFQDESYFQNLDAVTPEQAETIVREIEQEELLETLGTCKDSAPGPDGIPYTYIKEFWYIFGKLIVDAWKHSLRTKTLTVSHRTSFLKLIPKADKDLARLTNWRPITLSNCDHKLITKVYANRVSSMVAGVISGSQTAYLKGRLINDNIRSLIATLNIANLEDQIDGILISLDAKKAFDSVEHSYIEACLEKIGLGSFIPVFRVLYADLRSDILINGRITRGYSIRRGVKQGDALSCILFIICMEPLIRNIEANNRIQCLTSQTLESTLPKAYAYADDVNGSIINSLESVQGVFDEYARLTNQSGLELNADKTELMRIRKVGDAEPDTLEFRIEYLGKRYLLKSQKRTKINGIHFQQDTDKMADYNVDAAVKKIEHQLKPWSRRSLSILGKIMVVKTFGISQIIYLMQSMRLNESHFKLFNSVLYKFIWNRHFLAAKAPERIKREITNKSTKLGGLGMLDIIELDHALKIRSMIRTSTSNHPFLSKIKNQLKLDQFFDSTCQCLVEPIAYEGHRLLKTDRQNLLRSDALDANRKFIGLVKASKLGAFVNNTGKQSIVYNTLWRAGRRVISDLRPGELSQLRPFIKEPIYSRLESAISLNGADVAEEDKYGFFINSRYVDLRKISSKQIRTYRTSREPICQFKVGLNLTVNESFTWLHNLNKLSSTRHKNSILRIVHGDVYTKERLFRFGLIDSPKCPRCDEVEDILHKLIGCRYAKLIFKELITVTNSLRVNPQDPNTPTIEDLLAIKETNVETLLVHAEVLNRIMSIQDSQNYLLRPKIMISQAIKYLIKCETKTSIKETLKSLLRDY